MYAFEAAVKSKLSDRQHVWDGLPNWSEIGHTPLRRTIMIRETQEPQDYFGMFEAHLTASPVAAAHQGEHILLIEVVARFRSDLEFLSSTRKQRCGSQLLRCS